jgi:S-layer homology domain
VRNVRIVFALVCFSVPLSLFAQQEGQKLASETYGTSSLTYLSLSPWDFHPADSSVTYNIAVMPRGLYRTNMTGGTQFEAPLRLPEGALVSYLEMTSCNSTAMGSMGTGFKTVNGQTWNLIPGPFVFMAGCGVTSVNITPVQIDNTTTAYTIEASFPLVDQFTTLVSYRVGYKLQVSPPPGTATFGDVPTTHLFFQYVEALAAAGITSGCGGGNFCPDAAVTRGQMAVFLSKALGLHWAP